MCVCVCVCVCVCKYIYLLTRNSMCVPWLHRTPLTIPRASNVAVFDTANTASIRAGPLASLSTSDDRSCPPAPDRHMHTLRDTVKDTLIDTLRDTIEDTLTDTLKP